MFFETSALATWLMTIRLVPALPWPLPILAMSGQDCGKRRAGAGEWDWASLPGVKLGVSL